MAIKPIEIDWIRQKVVVDNYELSSHADRERQADKIAIKEIESALLAGKIIESYPEDPRGASCLVFGYGDEGCPIHIVCGRTSNGGLRIITVYIPTMPKWLDPRTRRK